MLVSEPYKPRPVSFLGLRRIDGWRLKTYAIVYGDAPPDLEAFEAGLAIARRGGPWLPAEPVAQGRCGAGFMIWHQGRGMHYLVARWWDRENELPGVIHVRESLPGAPWRLARTGEAECVWDLAVIWFERNAFVRTILARAGEPNIDGYLTATFSGHA